MRVKFYTALTIVATLAENSDALALDNDNFVETYTTMEDLNPSVTQFVDS